MDWLTEGIRIGYLQVTLLDIVDILLVSLIMYQLYKLLKGSLAFNIFIGILLIVVVWLTVRALDMKLMTTILQQFIGVGIIALLIIFQPEVRRFLLLLGKGSELRRSKYWKKMVKRTQVDDTTIENDTQEIINALQELARTKTGALVIIPNTSQLQFFANSGVSINSDISSKLLLSIFYKNSTLHDGAVIIADGKIKAAGCTLPISKNPGLSASLGMRHKAAIGISEESDCLALIVSEETGGMAYAKQGQLFNDQSPTVIKGQILQILKEKI